MNPNANTTNANQKSARPNTSRKHYRGKPKSNNAPQEFNPATAPILALMEREFAGEVTKMDDGRTTVRFTSGETVVERTVPRGMCGELEAEFVDATFNPATAPLAVLVEKGFKGVVTRLGVAGGKPTTVEFTNPAFAGTVVRTFPRGMCESLEQVFVDATFNPATAPLMVLVQKGFKGSVVSLGKIGGKPSKLKFTNGATTVVREFPRGMCKGLEDGFMVRNGVQMRPRPALRTR